MHTGPWYTLDDTLEILDIRMSELHDLITNEQLRPVVFTKSRPFLLFSPNEGQWVGHAVCRYRGAMTLHKTYTDALLDGDSITVGSGYECCRSSRAKCLIG